MGDFIKTKGVSKMDFVKMDGLSDIVKNHVVKGTVTKADMAAGKEFETLAGNKVVVADLPFKRTTSRSTTPRSTPSRRSSSKQDYGIHISFIIKQYFDANIGNKR